MEFISQNCSSINTMNTRHKKSNLGLLPRVHVPLDQQECPVVMRPPDFCEYLTAGCERLKGLLS